MELFYLKVLLSFIIGGGWITMMTVLSERAGTKIGGILTGLPSTGLFGLLFIYLTQDAAAMTESAKIMPASIALSTIFLICFVSFYKKSTSVAYFQALLIWLGLNAFLLALHIHDIRVFILITLAIFAISIYFFKQYTDIKPIKIRFSKSALAFRFVFSGSLVALSVIFAKLLGPTFGGVLASFPAAFSATLLILTPLYGLSFIKSLSKGLVLGAFTISSFAVSVYFLTDPIGAIYAIILSFLLSVVIAVCFIRIIK